MSQEDGGDAASRPAQSYAAFLAGLVNDCLSNIVHELVIDAHRTEKILRMQSAATQVSLLANSQNLVSPAVETPTKPSSSQSDPTKRRIETEGAVWDNGVITLKGNPMRTITQILCPQCKLPRLRYPLTGEGARLPDDLKTDYCTKHPYVVRAGHDIFGQPFPTMDVAKGKKEKELLKQQRSEKDSTPASQTSGGADFGVDDALQNSVIARLMPPGKGSNYIPWHTCPKCKRSLLITRFAQHLEKCMGISGRTASRNAMAKMGGQNGSIGGTPMGSRPGTPGPPASQASQSEAANGNGNGRKRDREDDDQDELDDVPLKKMKKRPYMKKADRERVGTGAETPTASQQSNKDQDSDERVKDKEHIKLKIKPPTSNGMVGKERDGSLLVKKPPKPGGGDETPTKKLKKVTSNSSSAS